MFRWLRIATIAGTIVAFIIVGVSVGLFLVENDRWERVHLHPWLAWALGDTPREAWLPALMAGWLVAILLGGTLLVGSLRYVWRRRQADSRIAALERELIELRNLPLTRPAPFEDVSEQPDRDIARHLAGPAAQTRQTRIGRPGSSADDGGEDLLWELRSS
ncbi:MAG: hypothetical protein AAGC55_20040 [Myxococcota bacterium]